MGIAQIHRLIFKHWRVKRLRQFLDIIRPVAGEVILDVGGYPHTWTVVPQQADRIDCLNLHIYPWREERNFPDHRINMIEGDACNLQFTDGSYPVLFSNSVIEHVGDDAAQERFAHEARRVGQRLWIQTPAFECPVEPHFLTLFIHWLPPRLRKRLARNFTLWGWLERPSKAKVDEFVDYTRLLTKKRMGELFPDCQIRTERLLMLFPKSYIAIRT